MSSENIHPDAIIALLPNIVPFLTLDSALDKMCTMENFI